LYACRGILVEILFGGGKSEFFTVQVQTFSLLHIKGHIFPQKVG